MPVLDITADDPFVLNQEELSRDPYPYYEQIRRKGNLVWSSAGNDEKWIAAGYNTVATILSDPRFGVELSESQMESIPHGLRNDATYKDLIVGLTKFMLAQDPPNHTRVRKLANKAFTRYEVAQMGARIEHTICELLDKVVDKGEMELIADFAFPLPISIICEVLGLPASDYALLKNWSESLVQSVEPTITDEQLSASSKSARELFEYLKGHIAERRKNPRNDLLTAFVQAEEEGTSLNMDEVLSNMLLLIIAGHETTVNMIGSGFYKLLTNPGQMDKLKNNLELLPSAIEEFLRIESPLQITERFVKADLELEGQRLLKGQRVQVLIGSANHDPNQFENPQTLNIERSPNKHLTFGQGIHFCLGAPLVRFETKMAFEHLLKRLGNVSLATEEVHYKPLVGFRGLDRLPIRFTAL